MRVLLDVDYCIAPLHDEWLRRYNHEYGDNLKTSQITEWDMTKFVKPSCGENIYKYLDDLDLYDNLVPVRGSFWAVGLLREWGHDVRFVTSGVNVSKIRFLRRFGFVQRETDFIITADKSLINGNILVDDYEKNLDTFDGATVLYDAPHNRHVTQHMRAKGWQEVVSLIATYRYR